MFHRLMRKRHATVLAASFGMLFFTTHQTQAENWIARCWHGSDCLRINDIVEQSALDATQIARWYANAGLPAPDVDRDRATGAPMLRVDPLSSACGADASGCYRRYKNGPSPELVVSTTGDNSAISDKTRAAVELHIAHEMLHAIQRAAVGDKLFDHPPSDHMVSALNLPPSPKEGDKLTQEQLTQPRLQGMIWLSEGMAMAVMRERAKVSKNTYFKLHGGDGRGPDLDMPLISPVEEKGDPYRLGTFFHDLGSKHPGGFVRFLKAVFTPSIYDQMDGIKHLNSVSKSGGADLRARFVEFVAKRNIPVDPVTSEVGQDFKYQVTQMEIDLGGFLPDAKATLPIRPYAAVPLLVTLKQDQRPTLATGAANDIQTVQVVMLEPDGEDHHDDITVILGDQTLSDGRYRKLYARNSAQDRWFIRIVNFSRDLAKPEVPKAEQLTAKIKITARPLVVVPPYCVLPGRQAQVLVNTPVEGLGWRVAAGSLVPLPVQPKPTEPNAEHVPDSLLYTAPDRAGVYAITLPTGPENKRVKVAEIVVTADPCRADLVWDNDDSSRSRYVFPVGLQTEGRPTAKELGGAEMVLRPGKPVPSQMPSMQTPRPGTDDFATGLHRDLAIAGGYLPPEMQAELKNLTHEERVVAEAALAHYRSQMGFALGDNIATFGSATRQFDMFDPNQAMDGIAEMIFRMMRLDRLPSNATMQRQGGPHMVRRTGQPCVHVARSTCTVVLMDGVKLTYSPDGVLDRFEGPGEDGRSGRVDISHNPLPRIREEFFMLTLMNRRPWEE